MPLLVVVDRNSWSAAEYFAAVLHDNRAARIVGELTGGAGCGYTNAGISTSLSNSGAVVRMPDCVRLRADGSNEVAGITPDVLVPWAPRDTPFQRASKLAQALETVSRKKEQPRVR
jgi:C-terminal processing protease CtpA/Prc